MITHVKMTHPILRFIHNGIIVVNTEGTIVFCNDSACKLFQREENELIGTPVAAVAPAFELHKVIEDGTARLHRHLHMGNQTIMLNQSPIYEENRMTGAIAIWQDIDVSAQIPDQYENAHRLLYDCILAVDAHGMITMISDSYAAFLGLDNPNDAIGKHCTEILTHTRIPAVLQTGKAEFGYIFHVNGQDAVAMLFPIMEGEKIVGAIGKVLFHDVQELKALVHQLNVMETKVEYYQNELKRMQGAKYSFESIIGNSAPIKEVKELAMQVAKSRSTVLLTGESGTGKELFAHAIHHNSSRSDGRFVRLNCAAIPRELLESELFGYEEGAFTGAKKGGKSGKIEMAEKGTLFLDEIGDMPLEMQAKMLRVLQEKEIQRVGGTKVQPIDVRFISATHHDLWDMVQKGTFREDLYYRLHVVAIDIPPLRNRGEDIMILAHDLMKKLNRELGTHVTIIDQNVSDVFKRHAWPGNIRELENVLERAMNVATGTRIEVGHLPVYLRHSRKGEEERAESPAARFLPLDDHDSQSLQEAVEMAERQAIIRAIKKANGNKQQAAQILHIHRASLYRKLDKYNLSHLCDV